MKKNAVLYINIYQISNALRKTKVKVEEYAEKTVKVLRLMKIYKIIPAFTKINIITSGFYKDPVTKGFLNNWNEISPWTQKGVRQRMQKMYYFIKDF